MKHTYAVAAFMMALSVLAAGEEEMKAAKTVSDVAKKAGRPAGAPEYADVCFRYGWIRKDGPASVEEAKKAMRAFHATRVDWFYPGTHTAQNGAKHVTPAAKAFIDWCHKNDMKIGGAINNNTKNPKWKYKKHHLDRFVGEPSNVEFIADILAWGKAQIDAGIDTMVCDDIFKYDAPRQKMWSEKVLAKLKAYKLGFTIAGNCGHNIGTDYVKKYAVDFHYSDNNFIPDPSQCWDASRKHRALKSAILLHPNKNMSKEARRKLIALGYANGAHLITPWDEYIHGKKRLFADPADFADLYGFARALGQMGYLNGYEDAAVGGYDLKETRYGAKLPIIVNGGSSKLSVFARAKPGKAMASVVVHLVEWSNKAQAFTLKLKNDCLFPGKGINAKLLVPLPYNAKTHAAAADKKDYGSLMKELPVQTTAKGTHTQISIPALTPWGIVILDPQ